MANAKSGRKKLLKIMLAVAIFAIIVFIAKIVLPDSILQPEVEENVTQTENTTSSTQETQSSTEIHTEFDGELVLTMIEVGQADSFLFEYEGKYALVDCGTRSTGKDVVEYLRENGITNLDYVFGTHPHDDHMGGMYEVITNVEVGKVIIPEVEAGEITANWYMKLIDELSKGNYEVDYPEVGEMYYLEDVAIKVIAQMEDAKGNTNNYSTVMKVTFGEMDIIMTGDAETEVEEVILQSREDISAEILKMGHHGSDTSSSEEFLDAIDPDYALISCKVGNKYKHPVKETMEKLEKRNIEVYRTDECGTVVATITATDVTFNCDPGDYLSGPELEERKGK